MLDYGAKKDTSALSTDAFNKAIDACHKNGGGKVVVPAGMYRSGTIYLKSNVNLHFEHGATLYASTDARDFPGASKTFYGSYQDFYGWYALIFAEGASNIAVTGYGVIDGNGSRQYRNAKMFPRGVRDGRPRNLLFIGCNNVTVEGITLTHAGFWNQHYYNCEDVMVNNIKVYNHGRKNNDGLDIDACRRFVLSNSIIDADDDAIVIKSSDTAVSKDITITNCVISSFANAIKCGTESTGGFQNISISNCVIKPSRSHSQPAFNTPRYGITGISLEMVDGGIMNGVSINNIVIEGTDCPLYVRLATRNRKHTPDAPPPPVSRMMNVQLSNILAYNTGNYSSSITGVPGARIRNIYLSNIRIFNRGGVQPGAYIPTLDKVKESENGYPQPTVWGNLPCYGLLVRHVEDIDIVNCTFKSEQPDPRPAVIAGDVDNLVVDGLQTDKANSRKALVMQEVKRSRVR
ncbi:glycoside hydrolase family 28 protein [Chitinophaga alhagiae]|uniref:glycoside hydrolase family 28 protein n=1 Tax=Chitinophaga alhagiae TaxID=2203219 RepID=UPI0018E50C41|nr:glycosyl hydrolase family 28 protein [Chitinophaga alhagiae]